MNADPKNIFHTLKQGLLPFRLAGTNSGILRDILRRIGWDLDALAELPSTNDGLNAAQNIKKSFVNLIKQYEELVKVTKNPPDDYDGFIKALILVKSTLQSLDELQKALDDNLLSNPEQYKKISEELQQWAVVSLLQELYPVLCYTLSLLRIISFSRNDVVTRRDGTGLPLRNSVLIPKLEIKKIRELLSDPVGFLKQSYLPEGHSFDDEMGSIADWLFGNLRVLCCYLQVRSTYGFKPGTDFGDAEEFAEKIFKIYLPPDPDGKQMDISLALSPPKFGGLGLVILFDGNPPGKPLTIGNWEVEVKVPEGLEGISAGTEKVVILHETEQAASVSIGIKRSPAESVDQRFIIGDEDRTHFDVPFPSITGNVTVKPEESPKYQYDVGVEIGEGKAVIEELLSATWQELTYSYNSKENKSIFYWNISEVKTPLIEKLFKIALELTLVFQNGELHSDSIIKFNEYTFGAKELGWDWNIFSISITEEGITIQAGEANFNFGNSWKVGWESLKLTLAVEPEPKIRLEAVGLIFQTNLIPWFDFELDMSLVFAEGGFQGNDSKLNIKKPKLEDLLPTNLDIQDKAISIAFGPKDPSEIAGELVLGWQEFTLTFNTASSWTFTFDFKKLYVKLGKFEAEADLEIHFTSGTPEIKKLKLYKPNLETLIDSSNPATKLHFDKNCIALQLGATQLNKILQAAAPSFSTNDFSGEIALRLLLEEGQNRVKELRLDWSPDDAQEFTLPGFTVTELHPEFYSLVVRQDEENIKAAFAITLKSGSGLKALSSFAWSRGEDERELQNEEKGKSDFLEVALTATSNFSLIVADFKEKGLPDFFKPVESITGIFPVVHPCPATNLTDSPPGIPFDGNIILKELNFPFLKPSGTGQLINVGPVPKKLDIEEGVAQLPVPISVKISETLKLASEVSLEFDLKKMQFTVNHSGGLKLVADKEEITGSFLGLTWRFKGSKDNDQDGKYHFCTLVTDKYDYRIKQADGCSLYLEYTLLGDDPIVFEVKDFELSEKGVSLTAEVLPRPARLNGLDTKFTFAESGFKIVENQIQSFTLAGSGPLPPDLVGEGTADVKLQFEQQNGSLTLVSGAAVLQGTKPLHCKSTRFKFTIDALGLKFHDDGKYHLYFTLTGTAQFCPDPSDDKNSALAFLSAIKIELVDCPLTGDVSVLKDHVNFLIELPKPVTFSFLGCFSMEIRGVGFMPQADVFQGDGAMKITGQLKFAQGAGDAANNKIDYHVLHIGLPEEGKLVPRIHFNALPVALNFGEAFKLNGTVTFIDKIASEGMIGQKGFTGEGRLEIQGMPPIAASFAFLRVRRDTSSPWVRAWFIYLQIEKVSIQIPVLGLYIREIGIGFGYRYTLASIKAADRTDNLAELLKELRELSITQGDVHRVSSWAVDLEEKGEDPRWTLVLKALFSQTSAAKGFLDWNEDKEKELASTYLFDAVLALRSDLTFFMAVRFWLFTNYYSFKQDPQTTDNLPSRPLFTGFILYSPRKKRLLAQLASNPDGHPGVNPPMPAFFQEAIKNGKFAATLLLEPGLAHYELGWPNQLQWSGDFGPLKVECQGGYLMRISKRELVIGNSFQARGSLTVEAGVDLGFVGASISATANVAFAARYIGVCGLVDFNADTAFYGAIGLEASIDFTLRAWLQFKIRTPWKTYKIRKTYSLSATVNFSAGLETGILIGGAGIRGEGTLSVSVLGHSLELSARFAANDGAVTTAFERTERFLKVGLEAGDVNTAMPGITAPKEKSKPLEHEARAASGGSPPVAFSAPAALVQPPSSVSAGSPASGAVAFSAAGDGVVPADSDSAADEPPAASSDTDHAGNVAPPSARDAGATIGIEAPNYSIFVIRDPKDNKKGSSVKHAYFVLLPKGGEQGFLPPPPKVIELPEGVEPPDYIDRVWEEEVNVDGETKKFRYGSYRIKKDFIFEVPQPGTGVTLSQYRPAGNGEAEWPEDGWNNVGAGRWSKEWKVNWETKVPIKHADPNEQGQGDQEQGVDLGFHLLQAFLTTDDQDDEESIDILDDKPTGRPENAHRDPRLEKAEGETVRDERVLNPSESAYESAVQGALEQFRSSPLFKHDTENNRYDKLLEQAFNYDPSIYGKQKSEEDEKKIQTSLREQQARQFRGSIIQEIVTDLKRYAEMTDKEREEEWKKEKPWWQESIPFLMGLVFKVEVPEEVPEKEALPAWLLTNPKPEEKDKNPGIWQRTSLDDSEAVPPFQDFNPVTTFNVKDCSFEEKSPQFDQVRQYADANTIAVAWDLNWSDDEKISALQEESQKEPEQHLLHYRVERQALDSKEADVVNTISPVKILHREKSVLTALKPRFQVVDHFSHETLADQAALPVTGLRYLYNITPIDFAGGTGRPLTLIATRYPNTPPLVPVDAKLVVAYELVPPPKEEEENKTEPSEKEVSLEPTLFDPKQQVEVLWTEPQVAAMNSPAISKYQLVFRHSDTMPIGSYGLDSSSQGPRTKSLPASNARPLPGDIVVNLDAFGPRTDRRANLPVKTLVKKGIYPPEIDKDSDENVEMLWRPESWRIFIRTVSINEIPSAIVPVQLSLQATSIGKEAGKITERGPEERQPAELEWLPKRINLPFLPPEDEGAVTGDAFFPMPKEDSDEEFRFIGDVKNIEHQRHPAGFRCIRFQWNQGPSKEASYPLDMNAGYKLLQLDIDAHTTATFKDNDLLAQALQPIQDVQMTEAEDLWLTPDNTLSPSQWEAWYPSMILRRPEENKANPAESDTALKPWYSWRESILVWPEWPGHVRRPEFGGAVLHPVLQGIVEALEDNPRDIAGLETYTVDVQALPATLPTTAINFFENLTDAKTDPYGWSALQRMGLSVTFSLRKKSAAVGFSEEDNKLITGGDLLNAVYGVIGEDSQVLWVEASSVTDHNYLKSKDVLGEAQRALNNQGITFDKTLFDVKKEQWVLSIPDKNIKWTVKRVDDLLVVFDKNNQQVGSVVTPEDSDGEENTISDVLGKLQVKIKDKDIVLNKVQLSVEPVQWLLSVEWSIKRDGDKLVAKNNEQVVSVTIAKDPDDKQNTLPEKLLIALKDKGVALDKQFGVVVMKISDKEWSLAVEYVVKRKDGRLVVYQEVSFGNKEHVHVELLFQPGKAVDLEKGSEVNSEGLLALMQLSLRPSIKQELQYAKMDITGPAGAEALLVFPSPESHDSDDEDQPNLDLDLILQSFSSEETDSAGQSKSQFTVEADKNEVEYAFTVPLNGKTTLLLRGTDVAVSGRIIQVWFSFKQYPSPTDSEGTKFSKCFKINPAGYLLPVPEEIKTLSDDDKANIRTLFAAESERNLVGAMLDSPKTFTDPSREELFVEKEHGKFTSYFTAPKNIAPYFSSESEKDSSGPEKWTTGGEWTKVKKYLEALNSAKPEVEKIEIPVFDSEEDKGKVIEKLKPAFLIWSRRFFDVGGQVIEKDKDQKNFQTGQGPWLATAYPRSGTPAYVTPDKQGRLTYDHLIQDRWAHNYRYYIKPYGRYDLLWRSFEESSLLWTDEQRQDFRQQRDKTETAGLNFNSAALDVVLDRTYPIDKPLVISSRRLDYIPKDQQAKQPGTTWEVIIAKHWEQSLIERNQTLVRQLSFRQVAFTLVRRFAYQKHFNALERYFKQLPGNSEKNFVKHQPVHNLPQQPLASSEKPKIPLPHIPSSFPEKPESEGNESLKESLSLPKRLGRFQQGALVVQMEGLPYYYEHKMILVAQTTTGVSPRNTITQRDFEYRSPLPLVVTLLSEETAHSVPAVEACWINEDNHEWKMEVTLRLARYWDCLPESAQSHWPHEDANVSLKPANGAMKTSALPDLDVVYQIVETFSGNVEVQEEIFFDQEAGKFKRLRLGRRFKENLNITLNSLPEKDKTSHLTLQFTLQAADGTTFEPATITSEPLSNKSLSIDTSHLPEGVTFDSTEKKVICTKFLEEDDMAALARLFKDPNDRRKIKQLLSKNVNTLRGRRLEVRARRGAATPVSEAFQAIDVLSSKTDGEGGDND